MGDAGAVDLQVHRLQLFHRRSAVKLLKIRIGSYEDIYTKIPLDDEPFGCFSLFALPNNVNHMELLEGGIQIELYSQDGALELICAGKVDIIDYLPGSGNPAFDHRVYGNDICIPITTSKETCIVLYFKTQDVFCMVAGEIRISIQILSVRRAKVNQTVICSTCKPNMIPPR
jgi:hypothetical protein